MSIRTVVLRGYGVGGTIPAVVLRGYTGAGGHGTPISGRRVIRGRGGVSRQVLVELERQEALKDDAAVLLLLLSE